jgi:sugar-specific transcriptional regulator TrmB
MDTEQTLKEIGLSSGETQVYLALLKLGSIPVSKIKEETKLHRTTIYDFIEKLLNKGLVNYIIRNSVKYYKATHPNKLSEFLKEKEHHLTAILPSLIKLQEFQKEDILIEVYKGIEGVKTILNEILRHGKDYVILGVDETMFKQKLGPFMDQFFRQEKEIGFKERILTSDDVKFTYDTDTAIYRYLPKESFNPTPTYVWGDNVAILIWEPFTVIKIKNAALADSFSKYFEILWKGAKTKL